MEQYERNILQHIEEHGCSVTSVFDPKEVEPPFSYSIGIAKSSAAPELIIIGLGSKLSHWMINEYNCRVRAGEQFLPGVLYLGFLEGFAVQFGLVAREFRGLALGCGSLGLVPYQPAFACGRGLVTPAGR